jgi:D-tyrosyl-tRNA(Tyr) deacylase
MRAVIQRVSEAEVVVGDRRVARIGRGAVVFLCIEKGDEAARVDRAARKIAGLRCFADEAGKMNLDLGRVGGSMLVVSQFTLAAELHRKGRRPGFDAAAPPDTARALYEHFVEQVSSIGVPVQTGEFGAHMEVRLVNDGPVTFVYEDRDEG